MVEIVKAFIANLLVATGIFILVALFVLFVAVV